jgi:hypothetical protein
MTRKGISISTLNDFIPATSTPPAAGPAAAPAVPAVAAAAPAAPLPPSEPREPTEVMRSSTSGGVGARLGACAASTCMASPPPPPEALAEGAKFSATASGSTCVM